MPILLIMEIDPQLLIYGGSLVAILFVAGLTLALGLGRGAVLANHKQAARAAGEVHDGFAASESAIGHDGKTAVLRDNAGRFVVLKVHGAHFAGRVLDANASAEARDGVLTINASETRFGTVSIATDDAKAWAEAINRVKRTCDA